MAYIVFYFISIFMYIITIPLLIISIITKNKCVNKNNLKISIFMIIYLISELFLIDKLVDIGLEFVLILVFSLISSIILIIGIIINKIKLSKNQDGNSNFFIKHYSKIFILPIVLIIAIVFLYELFIIRKSDLIMVYKEQSFLFANSTQVAVNNSYGKSFSLKHELVTKNKKEDKFIYYYFIDDKYKGINLDSSEDPELKKIDINIVSKIYKNILFNNNNDEQNISMENIVIIENTNYYIIEYYSSNGGSDRKVLYNNDKFVADLNVTGDLDEVFVLQK